mmetsp:Transcript_3492/g.13821  ORF Transcript_3492/g.13821 Transcript_3492/m.13821 type:complete len:89 (-) Transcript_3492:87-353(-)
MSAPPAKAVVSELDGDAYSIGRAVREAIFVVVLMVILAAFVAIVKAMYQRIQLQQAQMSRRPKGGWGAGGPAAVAKAQLDSLLGDSKV